MTPVHAYATGSFVGWLLKHEDITVQPQLDDDINYTDEVVITHYTGAHWHIRVLEPELVKPEKNGG